MGEWKGEFVGGWVVGRKGGLIDGWMNGRTHGWMDAWMDEFVRLYLKWVDATRN